jgi:hypothetical protein
MLVFAAFCYQLTLPACAKIVSHLRRLYSQQRVATTVVVPDAAHAAPEVSTVPCEVVTAADSGAVPSWRQKGDAKDEARLRAEFLQCRDAWHSAEVTGLAGHTASHVLKVRGIIAGLPSVLGRIRMV